MFSEPVYIPRALNTGTCIRQGDLFYSAGLHSNHVLATANTGEIRRGFGKNAGEWTGRVEISKEEVPAVGQHIAIHATLTARDLFLAYVHPSGPFTCIFSKTFPDFSCVGCG